MLEYQTSFESTLGGWSYKPDMKYKPQADTVVFIINCMVFKLNMHVQNI